MDHIETGGRGVPAARFILCKESSKFSGIHSKFMFNVYARYHDHK